MSGVAETLIVAATAIAIVAMLCVTALRAWRGWLETRKLELVRPLADLAEAGESATGTRIELAAVKERLKKLEAVASGVEL